MPYKRIIKKGKRTYKRTQKKNAIVPISKMPLGGFGPTAFVKLRYCQQISVTPTSATAVGNIFRANSIYDPDYTGTGHQPLFFDQWASVYNHYTVLGARIRADFVNTVGAPSTGVGMCGIDLVDSAPGLSAGADGDASRLIENGAKYKTLGNFYNSGAQVSVTRNFSARKFFGLQSIKDNRDEIGASVTTNPAELAYFKVWLTTLYGTFTDVVKINCVIDYVVMFSEKNTLMVQS